MNGARRRLGGLLQDASTSLATAHGGGSLASWARKTDNALNWPTQAKLTPNHARPTSNAARPTSNAAEPILAAADKRDAVADARDTATERREHDLDRAEMLDPTREYGAHWPERRDAGLNRAHAQGDRAASREDRDALTEDDIEQDTRES